MMKKLWTAAVLAGWIGVAGTSAAAVEAAGLPPPVGSEGAWSDFASRDGSEIAFGDALAAITDKASRDLLGKPVNRENLRRRIRNFAWRVRGQIDRDGARETAEALRQVIFVGERFVPDQDFGARAEAETAVLSSVLEHKRGVCLSLSLLYLAVADEAGLPLRGVSAPQHFFVRYSRGADRLNLETMDKGGSARSDSFYRRKFFVRKGEPFYLKNLTPKESLAVYLSQLGAIYTRAGKSDQAVELLEVARQASPKDPEIRTNLGVALRAAGRLDDAITAWRTAIILDPYDDVAHFQLARGLADRGDWLAAIYHHDESLRLGHAYDLTLLRLLEPYRPDTLSTKGRKS